MNIDDKSIASLCADCVPSSYAGLWCAQYSGLASPWQMHSHGPSLPETSRCDTSLFLNTSPPQMICMAANCNQGLLLADHKTVLLLTLFIL